MRSAEDYLKRKLVELAGALRRPLMACGYSYAADFYFCNILADLCWLDERENEFNAIAQQLLRGSMRVYGQIFYQHLSVPDFGNEIASTYAEAAYRLAYYAPERLLSESEFEELRCRIDGEFLKNNHTESEMRSRFGEPTHEVLGGQTTVHCYGCVDPNVDWVNFDYSRCYPPKDSKSYEWFNDPILRDVRRKNNEFELLPFGDWCRELQDDVPLSPS